MTDGENVYVFFRDFGLISYDAAGAVRWKKPMGPFANRMGAVASPIIAGTSLVLVLDQFEGSEIVALSLATGRGAVEDRRGSETDAWTTPALYAPPGQPAQIVTAGGGSFGGHSVESGARLWTHKGMAPAMVASPVVTGDTVVGFGYGYDGTPPFAEALTKSDKDGDGRLSVADAARARGGSASPSTSATATGSSSRASGWPPTPRSRRRRAWSPSRWSGTPAASSARASCGAT